ncbi:hypothetical protein K474DRAFT_1664876 [Panus rudis PR-1116 ss-1]|nr:hypothetical protein K474DRAFT_1664876 [Panus rudis PR-1116 ss-1]
MSEKTQGPIVTANRLAMSKALGAAFLNHQVEQLEKTVVSRTGPPPPTNNRSRRNITPQRAIPVPPKSNGGSPAKNNVWKREAVDVKEVNKTSAPATVIQRPREKDADIVVVDASVLIHNIGQLKRWCREGREEIVIVPLEALNTLDLLKKGSNALAHRARTASRVLESFVGTNPRIRVQRDDAFVLWENIAFTTDTSPSSTACTPEWVRRTICCARWELEHPGEEGVKKKTEDPKVVLAVTIAPDHLPESSAPASASPVPLPPPQLNKFEPRSSGVLIAEWAKKAGIDVFEIPIVATGNGAVGVNTTQVNSGRRSGEQGRRSGDQGRRSPEDERTRRPLTPSGRGRRNSHMRNFEQRGGTPPSGGGLVERPPAVMAMMEAVSQPSRVVRVLARGEKLEPDP